MIIKKKQNIHKVNTIQIRRTEKTTKKRTHTHKETTETHKKTNNEKNTGEDTGEGDVGEGGTLTCSLLN